MFLLPAVIAVFIGLMWYLIAATLKKGLITGMPSELKWIVEITPALYSYVFFIALSYVCLLIVVSSLRHVSNHIIISLDIIYLFSIMIPILFHSIKDSRVLLCK